jgi:hypothetical protein
VPASRRPDGDQLAPAECSAEVRMALRLLARALAAPPRAVLPALADGPSPATGALAHAGAAPPPLRMHAQGAWYEPPGEKRVDFRRNVATRRVLARLLEARLAQPGVGVPAEALIEAGWRGERIARDAALNRLRVLASSLRRLGLRGLLLSEGSSYLLDPRVPVEVAQD